MLRWFEQRLSPFRRTETVRPPEQLFAFIWHFAWQIWLTLLVVLIFGLIAAVIEVSLFAFLGQIVDLAREAENPADFFQQHGMTLLWMAFIAVALRPVAFTLHTMIINQTIVPSFTNLIRWQTHRYVLRQSLAFFQNDFAGRIANRIMQTGPALRQAVVDTVDALWFATIYAAVALVLFFEADPRLMIPLGVWIAGFATTLWYFVPRLKNLSAVMSEARSTLMGRIVDSYTNILTVKLFSHTTREDEYAREAVEDHTRKFHDQMRLLTYMESTIWVMNGFLIVITIGLALWLWSHALITLGAVAVAAGLVIRINNMSGWIMWVVTNIFENIGTVQEGIQTISRQISVIDPPDAKPLKITRGEILYDGVHFHYGQKGGGLMADLRLLIKPGEKVGLVGRSGAGKSTLVNLLLRFHDLEGGRILIDGQDISRVTQESLRAQIAMVTQDTSLLHRSVMDNIRYGRPDADERAVIAAAKQAHAHEFILGLRDWRGRTGYQAHVGERGVKLSGGQRQRIAIARVLLKDAPILILDEATSALDSEVEAAIQEQLYNLMAGKTVIAIAHRLSTIAMMDRLIVMDEGRIIEEGAHDALIRRGGLYAQLWAHQSGGFLIEEEVA